MLGQWLNTAAVRLAGGLVRRPSLAVPHIAVQDIRQLDFPALHARGIRAVIFDKDNTLTAPYRDHVFAPLAPAYAACTAAFPDRVFVVSNSAGSTDDVTGAAAALARALGCRVLLHAHKKPACGEEILAQIGEPAGAVALVGDRLLTDVLMANMHGMLAVHTQAFELQGDNPAAAAVRWLENRVLLPALRRAGVQPPPHPCA
eukprot:m.201073 g.201073  ORF g.201073 m.201073 type:complete len:202 (-) comp10103_c0_seq11:299-904(-)